MKGKLRQKKKKSKQNENKSILSISVNSETGMAKLHPAVSIDGVKVAQVSNWKDCKCKELTLLLGHRPEKQSETKRREKKGSDGFRFLYKRLVLRGLIL